MDVVYEFVPYGQVLEPRTGMIALDVGMRTVPGVIDHHHPDAEAECAASLVIKHPRLVLDHIRTTEGPITVVTHRLPDFDSLASIFLALRLLQNRAVDPSMEKIAGYARRVDSASLPKDIDLAATPYSILRALFAGSRKDEAEINRERLAEGLRFMRFLHARSEEGYDILENRSLFTGIDRYERAMRKVENDYFRYLEDSARAQRLSLQLPLTDGRGRRTVDGFAVRNPSSFLLKEWARRDFSQSSLGGGFSFLLTNFGNQRYILGVDPEKGINLRGLGTILNGREAQRREAAGRPFPWLWYEGNCPFFDFRIIDSPQDGTVLTHEDVVECVLAFGRSPD